MMRKTHDETEAAVAAILGGRVEDKDKNLTPPGKSDSSSTHPHLFIIFSHQSLLRIFTSSKVGF